MVKIHTCDFLLPPLLSSSSLRALLRTALSSPSEDVAYAAFRVLARIFWDSMKEGPCIIPAVISSRCRIGRPRSDQ